MLELYIFNKKSKIDTRLSEWDCSQARVLENGELAYSLGKFKTKLSAFKPILDELNFIFKESEGLESYFDDFNLKLELVENHSHVLSYHHEEQVLKVDAAIDSTFIPIYLYSFYYASHRKANIKDDLLYSKLGKFLNYFPKKYADKLKDFFEEEYRSGTSFDAGGHFYEYLSKPKTVLNTQILRNRALAGELPVNKSAREYPRNYYKHLLKCLEQINLKVLVINGLEDLNQKANSLINATLLEETEEVEVAIKKLEASTRQIMDEISELKIIKDIPENKEHFDRESIKTSFYIDELLYLINHPKPILNRLLNTLELIENTAFEVFKFIELRDKNNLELFQNIQKLELQFKTSLLNLQKMFKAAKQRQQFAVINLSAEGQDFNRFYKDKSGIETIPYFFHCPRYEYLAHGVHALFDNDSQSICSDLVFKSIESKTQNQGAFHYQVQSKNNPLKLSTKLKEEFSNIQSIKEHNKSEELELLIEKQDQEINEAADFVFSYYLLENEFEEYIFENQISKKEALYEFIQSMPDLQADIARYCILSRTKRLNLEDLDFTRLSLQGKTHLEIVQIIKDKLNAVSEEEIKDFVTNHLQNIRSSARKELLLNTLSETEFNTGSYEYSVLGEEGGETKLFANNSEAQQNALLYKSILEKSKLSEETSQEQSLDLETVYQWAAISNELKSQAVSDSKFKQIQTEIEDRKTWAKQYLAFIQGLEVSEEALLKDKGLVDLERNKIKKLFENALAEAQDIKVLKRHREWNLALARLNSYQEVKDFKFTDWLVLGGRWLLNGSTQKDIDAVSALFNKSSMLPNLSKKDYDMLNLFVSSKKPEEPKVLEELDSSSEYSESTPTKKFAENNLSERIKNADSLKSQALRFKELNQLEESFPVDGELVSEEYLQELFSYWETNLNKFDEAESLKKQDDKQKIFAHLLKTLEKTALHFIHKYDKKPNPEDIRKVRLFIAQKEGHAPYMQSIFGDQKSNSGLFRKLAAKAFNLFPENRSIELMKLSRLGEMFNTTFLLSLTLGLEDESLIVTRLKTFFDNFLNREEADYPLLMFHHSCAGEPLGFDKEYYKNPVLRDKMFELSSKTCYWIYKHLHELIASKTVLKHSSREYRDCLIGDFNRGIVPICYQHESTSIGERFWDSMRALSNFVINHSKGHPLPVVVRGSSATVNNLFNQRLDTVWIAALANPSKDSWDLNTVFKSPIIRELEVIDQQNNSIYVNLPLLTPYLTANGEIKQFYTSFKPEIIEALDYLAPLNGDGSAQYELNELGFVHALVDLSPDSQLPKPHVTMSANTHPQFVDGSSQRWAYPEAWSQISVSGSKDKKYNPILSKEPVHSRIKSLISEDFLRDLTEKGQAEHVDSPFSIKVFQTLNGSKGYLLSSLDKEFSCYGEPVRIMPLFLAGKIQNLMDEEGELLLKRDIPQLVENYAIDKTLEIMKNGAGVSNTYMLNCILEYVPYIYVDREDSDNKTKRYIVSSENNTLGGLDYYYILDGAKRVIASGNDHASSLLSLENTIREGIHDESSQEKVDIALAKIAFDCDFDAAEKLQEIIDQDPSLDKNLLIEWIMDLGMVGRAYQVASQSNLQLH